jgi:hypothetical protein
VSYLLGAIVGRIVPHLSNHEKAREVEHEKPLRIRGSIKDNRFFTGVWFHPNRRNHHHGAFDLLIEESNDHMQGIWLGYSKSRNAIESGIWEWTRLNEKS